MRAVSSTLMRLSPLVYFNWSLDFSIHLLDKVTSLDIDYATPIESKLLAD